MQKTLWMTVLVVGLTLIDATAARAQDVGQLIQTFAGSWYSFDPANSNGSGVCTVELSASATDGAYPAKATNCSAPLSGLTGWAIASGQIFLKSKDLSDIAVLGGNQMRVTGDYNADAGALILERANGDTNSAAIRNAVTKYRCIFSGFTNTCVPSEELQQAAAKIGKVTAISTLVNLNVRAQPRISAQVIGTIPSGTRIVVESCLIASDSIWCSATFDQTKGWFARTTLREDNWPIMTFDVAFEE